jgi:hypothetical protein
MIPHPQPHAGRAHAPRASAPRASAPRASAPRDLVRRSAALVAAVVVIGGAPLVAKALDNDEALETVAMPSAVAVPLPVVAPDDAVPDLAAATAADTVTVPAVTVPAVTVPTEMVLAAGPSASQWEALRQCESNGDYAITNPSGKYRGAYQFARSTWDSVAQRHAPSLVGADPAAASPADQDAMALALHSERGAKPWPHCGRHLS